MEKFFTVLELDQHGRTTRVLGIYEEESPPAGFLSDVGFVPFDDGTYRRDGQVLRVMEVIVPGVEPLMRPAELA